MNLNTLLKFCFFIGFPLIFLGLITVLDSGLAIGITILIFLMGITLIISKKDKTLISLLIIAFFIHLSATLFIHYTQFFPFGPGRDDLTYHQIATQVAERFKEGNFSLAGLDIPHYYPIFIGGLYAITLPEMLIGKSIGVWLAVISALLVYSIVQEIGGSKKLAFLIGILISVYPSYLFYGSLLLKDTLIIPFTLLGLLLIIKLSQKFSWRNFLFFLVISGILIPLRFYVGFLLLLTFCISWLFVLKINFRKKIAYGLFLVLILGILVEILGYGFFGIKFFKESLSPEYISFYRETAYAEGKSTLGVQISFDNPFAFLGSFLKSFINALFGPLPWQMKEAQHFLAIGEIIILYLFLIFILKGAINGIKYYRYSLPLLIFSIGLLIAIAIISDNLGTTTRLRMPAFIALFCLIPLSFKNIKKTWQSI